MIFHRFFFLLCLFTSTIYLQAQRNPCDGEKENSPCVIRSEGLKHQSESKEKPIYGMCTREDGSDKLVCKA